jgi:hypothetical protein
MVMVVVTVMAAVCRHRGGCGGRGLHWWRWAVAVRRWGWLRCVGMACRGGAAAGDQRCEEREPGPRSGSEQHSWSFPVCAGPGNGGRLHLHTAGAAVKFSMGGAVGCGIGHIRQRHAGPVCGRCHGPRSCPLEWCNVPVPATSSLRSPGRLTSQRAGNLGVTCRMGCGGIARGLAGGTFSALLDEACLQGQPGQVGTRAANAYAP